MLRLILETRSRDTRDRNLETCWDFRDISSIQPALVRVDSAIMTRPLILLCASFSFNVIWSVQVWARVSNFKFLSAIPRRRESRSHYPDLLRYYNQTNKYKNLDY